MRPVTQTLLIFLGCCIVFGLYMFLGKSKLDQRQRELRAEYDQVTGRLVTIQAKKAEIPGLVAQLPYWRSQFDVFRAAMPMEIGDEVFLSSLAEECAVNNVQLLGVELSPGGPWLGKLSEEQRTKLTGIGVDVEAAEAVKTATYTIRVIGEYAAILRMLEGLKRHGRMYTVDEFAGPAPGGAGAIVETLDQAQTPILVSGKIYYGLPEEKVSAEQVREAVRKIVLTPLATRIMRSVARDAAGLIRPPQPQAGAGDKGAGGPGEGSISSRRGRGKLLGRAASEGAQ